MTLARVLCLLLAMPLFFACDDDPAVVADAHPVIDAPALADATPAVDAPASDAAPSATTVFALGSDYQTAGIASTVSIPGLEVTQGVIDGVASTDPIVRESGGKIYIVNRFGADNVTVIDAATMTLDGQVSTGAGTNPQDVAAVDGTLYVAALNAAGVLVTSLNATEDPEVIDLSSLDPEDGIPNCMAIHYAESTVAGMSRRMLFVACGILDDDSEFLTPRGPGKVAVIDQKTHQVLTVLELTNKNPVGGFHEGPGQQLFIATLPNYGDLTQGCIESIHAVAVPLYQGCAVDNADLGGYASGLSVTGDGAFYVAVTEGFDPDDFGALGSLVKVDGDGDGAVTDLSPDDQRIFNVARCPTGQLAVADAAGGVRIYGADGTEITTELLDIGLPPVPDGLTCY
ncbi:MAG TPA: hypothetical protein VFG83_07630 [Kofleriaceae bacterium]|nr:hypothetical protein [Kofleriaceae bacterium]